MKKSGSYVVCSYVQEGDKVNAETFTWTSKKKVSPELQCNIFNSKKDERNVLLDTQQKNLEKGFANT